MAKFETKAKRIRAPSAIDDEMSYGAPVAWTPDQRSELAGAAAELSPAAFEIVVGEVLASFTCDAPAFLQRLSSTHCHPDLAAAP